VALRHRDTGALFGGDDCVVFAHEDDAAHFIARYACEPDAWETVRPPS
jgi:hypothetical protein